jgi:hypothetical protein
VAGLIRDAWAEDPRTSLRHRRPSRSTERWCRRERLRSLALAECLEADGRFVGFVDPATTAQCRCWCLRPPEQLDQHDRDAPEYLLHAGHDVVSAEAA